MKIAILGTRGIPARYGGFETFAEELAKRLATAGHDVEVHCRSFLYPEAATGGEGVSVPGVRLIFLPAIRTKHLETISHTFFSVLNLTFRALRGEAPDVALVCNGANAPIVWILRLLGIPYAINVDGIERKRGKWGRLGALWYLLGEWCSARLSPVVVSDADVIRDYYRQSYGVDSEVITYGFRDSYAGEVEEKLSSGVSSPRINEKLAQFGLRSGEYILYVSRLEPENNAHRVIEAYGMLKNPPPLVVVGNAPYASSYIRSLRAISRGDVRFYGFQFGASYELLQLGALLYIQATEVGGTHPALVESMGFGNCVLANQTPENAEVLGESGVLYKFNDSADLAKNLELLLGRRESIQHYRKLARKRVEERYSWENLTRSYLELFSRMGRHKTR